MYSYRLTAGIAALVASVAMACSSAEEPTGPAAMGHTHEDPLLAANAAPEVRQKIAELRQWSAKFHDIDKAAAAGYSANIGCIDETIQGLAPSEARGMGYHVTRGDMDLIGDGVVDIDNPEFLVYAPHQNDGSYPRAERLGKARLVGFDYYLPGDPTDTPPEFFGEPFDYSPVFNGWVRHIYLWGHNPDGMFENYNPAVGLCTELLTP